MKKQSKIQDDFIKSSPAYLTPEEADALFKNIMDNLDFKEDPKPVSHRHSYYYRIMRKYILKNALILCCVFLLFFFFLPGTVIPASISHVSAAPARDQTSARVEFTVNALIPVQQVSAQMNDHRLEVLEESYHQYSIDVSQNGSLLLEVYSATGMYSSQTVEIDSIDEEAPHIVSHQQENDCIKVYLTDGSGVGIDYSSITAYDPETGITSAPLDYNEEEQYILLAYPESRTYITVLDKNGNQMTALLSPAEGSS